MLFNVLYPSTISKQYCHFNIKGTVQSAELKIKWMANVHNLLSCKQTYGLYPTPDIYYLHMQHLEV